MIGAGAESAVLRRRTSNTLLIVTGILAFVAGPLWYAGELIRNEDRFVAVTDKVMAHPDIRRATAERATVLTLDALEADEAVAELLPGPSRSLAVPISQLATEAMTDAAFDLLDTEVAVQARHSALRELHGQLTAEGEDVVIDLRPVLTRVARDVAGPTAGSALTQLLAKSDDGKIVVAEADSVAARAAGDIRAIRTSSWFFAVGTLACLAAAIGIATDRRRAVVRGGLALSIGSSAAVLAVAALLQATPLLTETALGPEVGTGLAEAISADFGEQQTGGVVGGLILASVGLVLGPRKSAVALRSIPQLAWRHEGTGVLRALSTAVADNPALVRIVTWLSAALLLIGWPSPTGRVVTTTVLVAAAILFGIWFLSSPRRWAADRRADLDLATAPVEIAGVGAGWRRWRVNSGVLLVAIFLLWPAWSVPVVVRFVVVGAIVQAALDIAPARRLSAANALPDPARPTSAARLSGWGYVAAGAVAAFVIVGIVLNVALSSETAAEEAGCNGHVELCDRTIDEVVWAGSHNSMSSTDLGWELAAQTGDMVAQLDHGIRALLIDTHYWDGSGAFEGEDDAAAAAAIEAAVADDQPRPGLWLCHGPCALGATDLITGLSDIDVWLDENRRDVVLFVVQDEISPPGHHRGLRSERADRPGSPARARDRLPDPGRADRAGRAPPGLRRERGYRRQLVSERLGERLRRHPVQVRRPQRLHLRVQPGRRRQPAVPGQSLADLGDPEPGGGRGGQQPGRARRAGRRVRGRAGADPERDRRRLRPDR